MPKFRKKPVVIEARELTHASHAEVAAWCGGKTWSRPPMRAVTGITIPTLEGDMNADYGDWIIRGIKGEFYPCKPDIFAATYEPAADTAEAIFPVVDDVFKRFASGDPGSGLTLDLVESHALIAEIDELRKRAAPRREDETP